MLSSDPIEFRQLVKDVRALEKALGDGVKRPSKEEKITCINNRKSIIAAVDITKGSVITKDMLCIKRPGFGIQPKYFQQVIGRIVKEDLKAEYPISWEQI